MNKKNIIITGATGFVGRHLVKRLSKKKYTLAFLVRKRAQSSAILGKGFRYIKLDERRFRHKKDIRDFSPDVAIHLASYITSGNDSASLKKLLDSNIKFGTLFLDALLGTGIKHFINTGSFSEYYGARKLPDPAYLYSATKTAFRSILDYYRKEAGFGVANVVPYSIYGAGDTGKKALHYIIDSIGSPRPVIMTGGGQVLDFIYVSDVADFYLTLLNRLGSRRAGMTEYRVGTGVGTSIRKLARMTERLMGKKANIEWGALQYRPRDVMRAVAPAEGLRKIDKELGWKPRVGLEEGLRQMLKGI